MTPPFVIGGAGIGGLAAALALARLGEPVLILERAGAPYELGNGLQLGPNAMRILYRFGLREALDPFLTEPDRLVIRSAYDGGVHATMPLGRSARTRYHAPYCTLSRRALHRALTTAAIDAGVAIRYASPIVEFTGIEPVNVAVDGAPPISARGLIGADGLWSKVRAGLTGGARPVHVGHVAWRTVTAMTEVPEALRANEVTAWLGSRIHAVHYPIDGGATLNLVVLTEGVATGEGWEETADLEALRSAAADLAVPLGKLIHGSDDWRVWPLFETDPPFTAGRGAVTLVGDAAHPMLPYAAQGASMAIEDATALADAVAAAPDRPESAFRAYERARRDRVLRVLSTSRRNGWIFHLDGLMCLARDIVLRMLPDKALLLRYDWLYGGGPG